MLVNLRRSSKPYRFWVPVVSEVLLVLGSLALVAFCNQIGVKPVDGVVQLELLVVTRAGVSERERERESEDQAPVCCYKGNMPSATSVASRTLCPSMAFLLASSLFPPVGLLRLCLWVSMHDPSLGSLGPRTA